MPLSVMLGSAPNLDSPAGQQGPAIELRLAQCESYLHASALCEAFIREHELGGGNWIGGDIYQNGRGDPVARVSYNGRIWLPDGTEYEERRAPVVGDTLRLWRSTVAGRGGILGDAKLTKDGWRFYPAVAGRLPSWPARATLEGCLPRWVGYPDGCESEFVWTAEKAGQAEDRPLDIRIVERLLARGEPVTIRNAVKEVLALNAVLRAALESAKTSGETSYRRGGRWDDVIIARAAYEDICAALAGAKGT